MVSFQDAAPYMVENTGITFHVTPAKGEKPISSTFPYQEPHPTGSCARHAREARDGARAADEAHAREQKSEPRGGEDARAMLRSEMASLQDLNR